MITANQTRINEAHEAKIIEAKELISRLKKQIEIEEKTENKNYGHVGSIGHVNEELHNLVNFLGA